MTEKLKEKISQFEKKNTIDNDNDLKKVLKLIISKEQKKPLNKMDTELIDECVDAVLQIDNVDMAALDQQNAELTERILKKIRTQHHQETNLRASIRLKKPVRVAVIVICSTLLITATITCIAFEYNPVLEMYNFIKASLGITTVTENGITYTYLDNTKSYNSIEELIDQENLDIVYPTELPDDIKCENIRKLDVDGYNKFYLIFNEEELIWQINEKYNIIVDELIKYEKIIINNVDVYITSLNTGCEVIFYYNNYEYYISYTDYNKLINIIEDINFGGK